MHYIKSKIYETSIVQEKIMGPNPVKLTEELLQASRIPAGAVVMDLGSGQGVTSVFLAKEYGYHVFAADLWSNPTENMRFFETMGLNNTQIVPVHADANDLPFAGEFFDAVVCMDSYNYFGRDKTYLDAKLLPFVKHGGYLYICIPGMKKDCHDNLPAALLAAWTPEQLDYIHDAAYWRDIVSASREAEIVSIHEMESNEEVWNDWLACDNEYAKGDRRAFAAGGGKYLNFIAVVLRRK
ncbi:MAG: methyltransferase domain-containing protein [Methanocorpusculum sp.]|nr:methyltransferase domain-containing protein [Methanocorpusculum sp.]